MTDITDQDRRDAREWAEDVAETFKYDDEVPRETRAAVNYILATVDAPAPTLSERLWDIAEHWEEWETAVVTGTLTASANRAKQMEQDAEDRQEWNRNITKQVATLARERDEARAEVQRVTADVEYWKEYALERQRVVERLTAERVTEPSPTLNDGSMTPDPADVKPGEAWIVNIDGEEIVPGFKANGAGWICYRLFSGTTKAIGDDRITLVSRLVPAPRQITTREELDALADGSIIREHVESEALQKDGNWYGADCGELDPEYVPLPATVLYEPEA